MVQYVITDGTGTGTGALIVTETVQALAEVAPTSVRIVGGDAAVSPVVEAQIAADRPVQRSAGATRYETAVAVYDLALAAGLDVSTLWLATGRDWPDALTSGPIVGRLGQTVLLVDGLDPAGSPAVLDRLRVEPGGRGGAASHRRRGRAPQISHRGFAVSHDSLNEAIEEAERRAVEDYGASARVVVGDDVTCWVFLHLRPPTHPRRGRRALTLNLIADPYRHLP